MDYEIVNIDSTTIEIKGKKVKTLNIKDVVIVQVPVDIAYAEKKNFLLQIKTAFPGETVIITTEEVKFCRIKGRDE